MDVDGTLYRLNSVRQQVLWCLLRSHWHQPAKAWSILRILRAYRNAQEVLRRLAEIEGDISSNQIALASNWTGVDREVIRSRVTRWMEEEPLKLMASTLHTGVREFLVAARLRGLRLAAVSDYPAHAKLVAMGLEGFFDAVVVAQDPEVQFFKPNPRGLEVALRRLKVTKDEALYIGDRPEVDALAAARAGIAAGILGRRNRRRQSWIGFSDYTELRNTILGP